MKRIDQSPLFPAVGWQPLPIPSASVRLWREWLVEADARYLYEHLAADLQWDQPSLTIAGKTHRIPRLQAWYGDAEAVYRYSGSTFIPLPWTPALVELKNRMEITCGTRFNSMLANWYRQGDDGMGFHADNEPELGHEPVIASLSLGGMRRFVFKPNRGLMAEPIALELHGGDLLEMSGQTQHQWRHGVPKTARLVSPRINLTFRYIHHA